MSRNMDGYAKQLKNKRTNDRLRSGKTGYIDEEEKDERRIRFLFFSS